MAPGPAQRRPQAKSRLDRVDGNSLWLALALMLVFEGLLPLLSPSGWRRLFEKLSLMSDGQLRFYGLCSIALGLAGMVLASFLG